MLGREFLGAARHLLGGTSEACWRVAAGEAYYGLMLECRELLFRWGFHLPRRDSVHAWVRFRFVYSSDPDLQRIGDTLDKLAKLRSRSQYDLQPHPDFTTPGRAQQAIRQAVDALVILDAIDGNPVRQAAARAAIRP
jgi:hypothetical protein